jgi:ribonuclease HI
MALTPNKGLLVYTDGSYTNKGPGGWSWVAVDAYGNEESRSGFVPPPTTNNRMEMLAMVKALGTLLEDYGPCEIEIVSDSAYVVMGCQDPKRARNVNNDIWDDIEDLASQHEYVQWRHIRGHVGVKYNELADELAVTARKEAKWQPHS